MSESKVSCPHCGQHLVADDAWRGQSLTCPSCQKSFTIPDAPLGRRIDATAPPPPLPGPPPPQLSPPPPPPSGASPTSRTSGLAIASLVLSFLGCLAIGGVICGHLARKQIRRDPTLGGGGLALAGLIIGYLNIVLTIVLVLLAAGSFLTARQTAKAAQHRQWGAGSGDPTPQPQTRPVTRPSQKPKPAAPEDAVAGQIKDQTFTYSAATLHQNMSMFTLREGEGFLADREVKIFLFAKPGESLENRTWSIKTTDTGMRPHVHLTWQDNGTRKTEIVSTGYELELKTGSIADGVLTGSLSLKVTGKTPAALKGNFAAVIE